MNAPDSSRRQRARRFYELGNAWRLKGQPEAAGRSYRRALEEDRDFLPAWLELADLQTEIGGAEAGRRVLTEALPLTESQPRVAAMIRRRIGFEDADPAAPTRASPSQPASLTRPVELLFYTDCPDPDGVQHASQPLLLDLAESGVGIGCAQTGADHPLVRQRLAAGIRQIDLRHNRAFPPPDNWQPQREETAALLHRLRPRAVVFADGSPISNLGAKQATAETGIPFIVINHCFNPEWVLQHSSQLETVAAAYRQASEVVAVSRHNLAGLRAGFGLAPGRGKVIYNGCPDRFFAPRRPGRRARLREALGLPADGVVALTVARLESVKGFDFQLEALRTVQHHLDQLYFLWVGDGTLYLRLWARIIDSGLQDRVRLLGRRSDIEDLLDASDLCVLPSRFEGMPLAVIEAMARGLPVAATNVGGTPEALGPTGKLLPDPSSDEVVGKLVETLQQWSRDAGLRRKLGADCRRRARELFGEQRMLKDYRRLLSPLLELSDAGIGG